MIDDRPYIIVDNQKISPFGSSPRLDSMAGGRTGSRDQPFGIVDRVTISREALARSRWQQARSSAAPAAVDGLLEKPSPTATPMLTYSPEKLR